MSMNVVVAGGGIGGLSAATVGVILRSLVGLSDQGADAFFGEPEFDTADLHQAIIDFAKRDRRFGGLNS